MHSKMFLRGYKVVIKVYCASWFKFWRFLENITWACLLGLGLKLIFHCIAQSLILLRSLFKLFAKVFTSWTTEKSEVSFANRLTFVIKSSQRSLIWMKNNNGPSINHWGTPASILVHEENFPFKATLCSLEFKKIGNSI